MQHQVTAPPSIWKKKRMSRQRGVSLVEVIIVVAILAMVASGVALFALPQFEKAQVKTANTGALVIRQAVQQWQVTNTDSGCPTVSQLVAEKFLDKAASTTDPWGKSYQLSCDNDDVTVASAGPDKKMGTADDIQVPKAQSEDAEAAE